VFKPSTYKINLSSEFLQGLQDGEILLKFHFWSGETIEYTLIKDGDIIKGISSQSDSNLSSDDGPGIDDTTHVASGSPQGLCRNCAKREEECCIQDIHRHLLQEA
jgi:hypothetical protein